MSPEEMAYCVRHDFQRSDPTVKRLLDENDRLWLEEHERLLRDDPAYAQRWHANIRAFTDAMDEQIARDIYRDLRQGSIIEKAAAPPDPDL